MIGKCEVDFVIISVKSKRYTQERLGNKISYVQCYQTYSGRPNAQLFTQRGYKSALGNELIVPLY